MKPKSFGSLVFWAIFLALAALLWAAPAGLMQFRLTALPTQAYYSVLAFGGLALLAAGGWLWRSRRRERKVLAAVCAAALVLGVNQATGLALNSILCFSAG